MRVTGKAAKQMAKKLGVEMPKAKSHKVALRGVHASSVHFQLPWPPSTNNLYVNVGKRRVPSQGLRTFKKKAAAALLEMTGHVTGAVSVHITAHPPDNRRRDIDGLMKAPLDAITEAGIWEDDSQIKRLEICLENKSVTFPEGTLCISIWEIV